MCESSEGSAVAEADSLQRFRGDPTRIVDVVSRGLIELKYNFVQEVERLQQSVHRSAGPLQPHGISSTQPVGPNQQDAILSSQQSQQSILIQRPTSIPHLTLGNAVSRVPSPPLSPAFGQREREMIMAHSNSADSSRNASHTSNVNNNTRNNYPANAANLNSNATTNANNNTNNTNNTNSNTNSILVEAPTSLLAAANLATHHISTDSSQGIVTGTSVSPFASQLEGASTATTNNNNNNNNSSDDQAGGSLQLTMRRPLDTYSSHGSVTNSVHPRISSQDGSSSDFIGTQAESAAHRTPSITSAVVSTSAAAAAAALAAAAAASPTMVGVNAAAAVTSATSSPRTPGMGAANTNSTPTPILVPTPAPAPGSAPAPPGVPPPAPNTTAASAQAAQTPTTNSTPASPVAATASPISHGWLQSGRSFFGSGVNIGEGDNTRRSRLESLTHAYNARMSVTEGSGPRRGYRQQQTGLLRQSPTTLSDFLYADDRAAREAAKEKGILEVLKSNERSAQSLPEPVPVVKKFVESLTFELFMGVAIFTNSLLIGIEVQYRTVAWTSETPIPFYLVSHFYALLFTAELVLRIHSYGPYDLFIRRGVGWAWLDLLIVTTALTEMSLDLVYLLGDSDGRPTGFTGLNQVRVTRILRITRLVRTLRIQRIIRFVAPLRTLVFSILATLRSLTWAMVLLILLVYVAGVVVAQGALDFLLENEGEISDTLNGDLREYWLSLDRAMFTLFQTFTGGISWRETIGCLEQVSFVFSWLVTAFISFVFFAMLNVMTGVFCSSAIETAQRNPEVIATSMISSRNAYTENLRSLFHSVDEDGTGLVTLIELEKLLKNELMSAHLRALEIDVSDAWTLFRLLDTDRSGVIEVEEFLSGCEHLKGHAKGIDLATLGFEVRNLGRKFVKFMKSTEKQLDELQHGPPPPKMLDELPGEKPLNGVLSGGTGPTGSESRQKHSG